MIAAVCAHLLRFNPIFRRYLWGGRRLESHLHKPLGAGDDYAESWEIVDHGADQSVVRAGPLAGVALGELVHRFPRELLGSHAPVGAFPLLLKFLDCQRTLSVQVHPNDQQAAQLDPPDLGKTEAWVVLAADAESRMYAGLREGLDRATFATALAEGRCEEFLHEFHPRPGDCVFIPAGTVHALGAGLLIAEIQQASDTTYRLFDFNRVDADGNPRTLHIAEGLAVTDFERGPVSPQTPEHVTTGRERLVECDKFILDRVTLDEPDELGGDERFHVLALVEGKLTVAGDPVGEPLAIGDSALLPAAAGATPVTPHEKAVLLDIYLPSKKSAFP
jgi:mannose-6-phosphate isomerase